VSVRTRASSAGGTLIQSGTLAERPAAGAVDSYYWATDIYVLFRDTGVAWEAVAVQPYRHSLLPQLGIEWFGRYQVGSASIIGAGDVHICAIQVPFTVTVSGIMVIHGGVAGGNLRVGLYENGAGDQPDGATLLAESASTACNGIDRGQLVPFTSPVQIVGGLYWLANQADNTNDTYANITRNANEIAGDLFDRSRFDDRPAYGAFDNPMAATSSTATDFMKWLNVTSIP